MEDCKQRIASRHDHDGEGVEERIFGRPPWLKAVLLHEKRSSRLSAKEEGKIMLAGGNQQGRLEWIIGTEAQARKHESVLWDR